MEEKFHFQMAHIGINCANTKEAESVANTFKALFGFSIRETEGAFFSNEQFEILKNPYYGRFGHISILTDHIEEAKKYLESKGIQFEERSAVYGENGALKVIYFADDIAGFRIHLTSRQ